LKEFVGAVGLKEAQVPAATVLKDSRGQDAQLTGNWYEVKSTKLELLDSKTIRFNDFSFQGSKPPGTCKCI
jgi:hypothetical protein